jgi:hypothetical protein
MYITDNRPERPHNQLTGVGIIFFERYSRQGSRQAACSRGLLTPEEDQDWGTVVARLKVISGALAQAGRRAILKVARGQPIRSSGRLTFECGNCGAVVLENVNLEQVRDCIIQCDCGAYNDPADVP